MNALSFAQLKLSPELLNNLSTLGYEHMTPIQAKSLPLILEKKDLIAQAKTGSGKTAAFGLGLVQHLNVKKYRVQSLVLCPTRELADQVAKELRKLARAIHNVKVLTLCGGMPFGPQLGSLEHGAHIIVGTPGRIEEHLRKGNLKLDHLSLLVLDEADRMLDMGFQESLDEIISYTPKNRQTLLFSATFPAEIETIAKKVMRSPVRVTVDNSHDEQTIEQLFFNIDTIKNISENSNGDRSTGVDQRRTMAIKLLLLHHRPSATVIFCNTKRETQALADTLSSDGFAALALHGDLEQRDRDETLVCFANKSASILVATDVAARGLDIEALDAVINYHISRDLDVHVHRVGRTGRGGNQGIACTLFSEKEHYKIEQLEQQIGQEIKASPLPTQSTLNQPAYKPPMTTLQIDGGKKQKVRAGDILGALTGENGIDGKQVGKIHLFDNKAYVAVKREVQKAALKKISQGKLKGRNFRVRKISL